MKVKAPIGGFFLLATSLDIASEIKNFFYHDPIETYHKRQTNLKHVTLCTKKIFYHDPIETYHKRQTNLNHVTLCTLFM